MSAAGEALHRLPAERGPVPDLDGADDGGGLGQRRRMPPDERVAAMSVMIVVAPITRRSPSRRIPGASSGIRLTSMTRAGAAEPSRRRMIRSVPPARTRASGPRSASRATASARDAGRA